MSQRTKKDNSGIMFVNKKKTDKHPDRRGYATVNGVEYYVSGWIHEGKTGQYMSMAFTPRDKATNSNNDQQQYDW